MQEQNIHSVLIPAAYTGKLQPMDISVIKVVKSFLRSKFSQWYSDELTKLFMKNDDEPVDLSMPQMKCVSGQWACTAVRVFVGLCVGGSKQKSILYK